MAEQVHEFTEDIDDYSMCVCGIPALYHEQVMWQRAMTGLVLSRYGQEATR